MSDLAFVEQEVLDRARELVPNFEHVLVGARRATESQKGETIRHAVRANWPAVLWSMLFSTALIMEGYDTALIGNFYALPAFASKYGEQIGLTGTYTVTAAWQTGLSVAGQIGSIIGLFLNGWACDHFGYKPTMLFGLVLMTATIFIPSFATNIQTLLAGQILQGIPWGIFQTLTTSYAADITPLNLRPYLTTYVNLSWVFGQLLAQGVLRGLVTWTSQWGYRLPFMLQWIFPALLIPGVIFAPESPAYLVRRNKVPEAINSVQRLTASTTPQAVEDTVNLMIYTNAVEASMAIDTSYHECFKGHDRRRTEVAVGAWISQVTCGSGLSFYAAYFLLQAGVDVSDSFTLAVSQSAIGVVGTLVAWLLLAHVGRRRLYLVGLGILLVILIVIGGLGWMTDHSKSGWAVGGLLLFWAAVYDGTLGPACYILVAETPSTRLRVKTIAIARSAYNVGLIVVLVILPYMINPLEWNWQAKSGLFWAGTCLITLFWVIFRLPETKGRTPGELDVLFENKVPAWRFASTKVDQFQSEQEGAHGNGDLDAVAMTKLAEAEKEEIELRERHVHA